MPYVNHHRERIGEKNSALTKGDLAKDRTRYIRILSPVHNQLVPTLLLIAIVNLNTKMV